MTSLIIVFESHVSVFPEFFRFVCFCFVCVFAVRMNPIVSFELLFFAVFGQTTTEQTQVDKMGNSNKPRAQPEETDILFKIIFGIYMLVSVIVLINLLIAMMSDTYQRIQVFCPSPCYQSTKKKKSNSKSKIQTSQFK